ncbi:MAG: OmpA family protein [Candidatus Latescibacteria bacterium]|nr:OmpA family protein [Candidatus Latescibacterota bacterium]
MRLPAPLRRPPHFGVCLGWAVLLWVILAAAAPQQHAAKVAGDSTRAAADTVKVPADSSLAPLPKTRTRVPAAPDTVPPKRPAARYRIVQPYVPGSATERQVAISRGRSKVNLGSRDGVQQGSIFSAVDGGLVIGLVQVDSMAQDTSWVRLIKLENVLDPRQPYPLDRDCELQPKLVALETIHFDGDTPLISPALEDQLAHMAGFIRAFPEAPVLIEGHSDNSGKKGQPLALSLQRAERIKTYLSEYHRIPKPRMYTKGYGDTRPLAANADEAGRRQNRRVEILMVDKIPIPAGDKVPSGPDNTAKKTGTAAKKK